MSCLSSGPFSKNAPMMDTIFCGVCNCSWYLCTFEALGTSSIRSRECTTAFVSASPNDLRWSRMIGLCKRNFPTRNVRPLFDSLIETRGMIRNLSARGSSACGPHWLRAPQHGQLYVCTWPPSFVCSGFVLPVDLKVISDLQRSSRDFGFRLERPEDAIASAQLCTLLCRIAIPSGFLCTVKTLCTVQFRAEALA